MPHKKHIYIFFLFALSLIGCSEEKKNFNPVTTNIEKKRFVPKSIENESTNIDPEIHATNDSIRQVALEAKRKAEMERTYGKLRELFSTYNFIRNGDTFSAELVSISPPNDDGEGTGEIMGLFSTPLTFTYTVYNDSELHLVFDTGVKSILYVYSSMISFEIRGEDYTYDKTLK